MQYLGKFSMVQRVLLTGANGFVGSHILDKLLIKGFSVRAVIRSDSKAAQVLSDFPNFGSQLDFGIVPDITAPGAFNEVVQSVPPFDNVIHTASPFLYGAISSNLEFLEPAIKGTLELLQSIKAYAPTVTRVIITSSCAAVVDFASNPITSPKKIYTESDWNPVTWDSALSGTPNTAYQASKKFAEKAAWGFLEREKPNFDLVTLAPPMVYGPLRHSINGVGELNESNLRIYNLFVNSKKDAPLPPNTMHLYTDVRDIAAAHVKAIAVPEAANKRFVICAGQVSSQEICNVLRKNVKELEERTPVGEPGGNKLDHNAYDCSAELAKRVLGVRFRGEQETLVELARQLLVVEEREKL